MILGVSATRFIRRMEKQLSLDDMKSRVFGQTVFLNLIFFWVFLDKVAPLHWHQGTEKVVLIASKFILAFVFAVAIYKLMPMKYLNRFWAIQAILTVVLVFI